MGAEELIEEKTGESEYERTARELGELLQELRVALPGVQVLFAFLLTVPFSARFGSITPLQEVVFFATLVCTALSAVLLLAPSAHHRLLWRCHARERRLRVANRFAIAGMILLALAMMGLSSLSPTSCSVRTTLPWPLDSSPPSSSTRGSWYLFGTVRRASSLEGALR